MLAYKAKSDFAALCITVRRSRIPYWVVADLAESSEMKVSGLFCCMNIKTHSRKFAGKSAFASCYKVKALYNFAKRMRLIMKRFHRRCRRLCILAALLVLLVLFLRQNVLLDTASRHAILLNAQSGRVLAQKRADERTAPASLTKMMTVR